jgi:hypothetical protein
MVPGGRSCGELQVEYDRAGARVLQTTEVREEAAALLQQIGVPLPQRFHAIEPVPPT